MGEIVSYRSNGGIERGLSGSPGDRCRPAAWSSSRSGGGWSPHIKSLADRFAEAGFVALAPDLYHGEQASEPDEAGKLMMGLAMDQAAKDIAGAADYLAGLDGHDRSSRRGRVLHGWQPRAVVGDALADDRCDGGLLPAGAVGADVADLVELRRQGRPHPLLGARRDQRGARHQDGCPGDYRGRRRVHHVRLSRHRPRVLQR